MELWRGLKLALLLGVAGCAAATNRQTARPRILTSFLPAYSLTANVAGDLAVVENLASGATGPHESYLSPRDLRRLGRAKLLVVNGLQLESWLPKALTSLEPARRPEVVKLTGGLDRELIGTITAGTSLPLPRGKPGSLGQAVGAANPHTWLDPTLAAYGVTNILRALQQVDPLNSEGYARNARAFLKRLAALDQDLAAGTATLRSVPFITLHDAFPYFVRRYGLELVGVVKMAPDVEPSPRQLSLLYGVIRQRQAQVLFKESSDRSRLPEQIARDTNIRLAELDTLETGHLTPDAYEEGLRHNLRVLQEHLAAPRLR